MTHRPLAALAMVPVAFAGAALALQSCAVPRATALESEGVMRNAACTAGIGSDVPAVDDLPQIPPEGGCWLVGCEDGLAIFVLDADGMDVTSYRATLVIDGTQLVLDCTSGVDRSALGDCYGPLIVVRGTPNCVEFDIVAAGGQRSRGRIVAAYRLRRPNGPSCPPACRIAHESVVVR